MIAPVDDSSDDVREILDRYAREGYVVRSPGGAETREHVEVAASLAATTCAADWLIWSQPNEFWWPRGARISDVLLEFVPRGGDDVFAERMTVRDSLAEVAAGDEPLLHRLRPIRRLERGVGLHRGQPLRAWYPIEVLRFPRTTATEASGEDENLGSDDRSLVVDERLRDALRALRDGATYRLPRAGAQLELATPTVVDDALYAVECAAVGEVNLDRLDRQIRELELRMAELEMRFWPSLRRTLRRLARRPS